MRYLSNATTQAYTRLLLSNHNQKSMYRYLLAFFALSLVFVSCNSKDDTTQEEEQQIEENFYALTVGNTWNYEFYKRVSQSDEFESIDVFNAVEITGTTQINAEEYYIFTTTTTGNDDGQAPCNDNGLSNEHFRDSLGHLINEHGKIKYSQLSTTPYLIRENEWGDIFGVLKEGTNDITVEAGSFTSIENEIYAVFEDGTESAGRDHHFFADGIGLVQENHSTVSNPIHIWENRLKSYQLVEE